jgi:hypothetical protein
MLSWGYVVPGALLVCLGVVYGASTEDTRLKRQVALKFLPAETAQSSAALEKAAQPRDSIEDLRI